MFFFLPFPRKPAWVQNSRSEALTLVHARDSLGVTPKQFLQFSLNSRLWWSCKLQGFPNFQSPNAISHIYTSSLNYSWCFTYSCLRSSLPNWPKQSRSIDWLKCEYLNHYYQFIFKITIMIYFYVLFGSDYVYIYVFVLLCWGGLCWWISS